MVSLMFMFVVLSSIFASFSLLPLVAENKRQHVIAHDEYSGMSTACVHAVSQIHITQSCSLSTIEVTLVFSDIGGCL